MAVTWAWCQDTRQGRDGDTALPGIQSSHPDSLCQVGRPQWSPLLLRPQKMEFLSFQVRLGEMRRPVLGNGDEGSLSLKIGGTAGASESTTYMGTRAGVKTVGRAPAEQAAPPQKQASNSASLTLPEWWAGQPSALEPQPVCPKNPGEQGGTCSWPQPVPTQGKCLYVLRELSLHMPAL